MRGYQKSRYLQADVSRICSSRRVSEDTSTTYLTVTLVGELLATMLNSTDIAGFAEHKISGRL
jgi:hypothetical protein